MDHKNAVAHAEVEHQTVSLYNRHAAKYLDVYNIRSATTNPTRRKIFDAGRKGTTKRLTPQKVKY